MDRSSPSLHGPFRAARAVKARSLQDLQQIQRKLAEQQKLAAQQEAARKEAQQKAEAERSLFVRAAGEVQPLRHAPRVHLAGEPPAPIAVQQLLDEQRVLLESISDEFDASTLLDVDDALSFRRPGVGLDVTRKLRKGHWSIQREIDLHGLRREDAREALAAFIREAHRQGVRCVRVVHGKGLGSPGRTPVLKARVQGWLVQKKEVLAFVQARGDEGGAGALVVLLKPLGPGA
jgi:DNA-nicking Smr family endonuclease